ncbi:MAG: MFS transporter [Spirochaetaceae bacterium]
MRASVPAQAILVALPFVDVLTEIGFASAFPQLRGAYGSTIRASLAVAVSPLFAVLSGWLWGALVRRIPTRRVVTGAMLGWALVTSLLGIVVERFVAALFLRALQGLFSAGFAALPFIVFARRARGDRERAKSFGALETSVSAGAILAPVSVGTMLATAPQAVLRILGVLMFLLLLVWLRVTPRGHPPHASAHGSPKTLQAVAVARRVLMPTAFAAGVALVLGTFETLIPTVVEEDAGSVLVGKSVTMAFELAVVAGILWKARRPAVTARLPLVLAAAIAVAYLALPWPGVPGIMLLAGFPVGAAVTMGNEFAAARVEGAEDVGMGLYSTLRITGSFLGPLFMNITYPAVLAALAAVSLACAGLVYPGAHKGRNREAACGNYR